MKVVGKFTAHIHANGVTITVPELGAELNIDARDVYAMAKGIQAAQVDVILKKRLDRIEEVLSEQLTRLNLPRVS